MRYGLLLALVLTLAAGQAFGLTYTWINTATSGSGRDWQTGSNWDLGKAPTTSDTAVIGNGGIFTTTANITVGAMLMSKDCSYAIGSYTVTTINDNGNTGDYRWSSTGSGAVPTQAKVTVYGNFQMNGTTYYTTWPTILELRGNGTGYRQYQARENTSQVNIYGTNIWDNVSYTMTPYPGEFGNLDVKVGGSIGANPTPTTLSTWHARNYVFEGGQSNLPALGSNVNFQFDAGATDNNTHNLVVTGGVTYPQDIILTTPGLLAKIKNGYDYRAKGGNIVVTRDFGIDRDPAAGNYWGTYVNTAFWAFDNATGNPVNVTVGRDLNVGYFSGNTSSSIGLSIFGCSATGATRIRVGRDLTFGTSHANDVPVGCAQFGNATIYLGRNFVIQNPHPSDCLTYMGMVNGWSAGTSTVICDGNETFGTVINRGTQTLTTWGNTGIALNNLVVKNIGGVTLTSGNGNGGDLRLTGNLDVENGSFVGNGRPISFNGPSHVLTNKVLIGGTYNFDDNINLLTSSTVVTLGSNITIKTGDNLSMVTGSQLYLNGFTLVGNGRTWISNQVSSSGVPYTLNSSNGTIFGTLSVPEPATLLLLASGALGAFGYLRHRRVG